MNSLRSFLFAFIILLVIFGWLFQIGLTIEGSFLTNDFYRKLFEKVDLTPYARAMMYEEIEKSLPLTLPESTIDKAVSNLSTIYDKNWLEKELLIVIDDLILYVKGKKPPPPLLLNLAEKNELLRDMIKDSLITVKKDIPFLSIFDALLGDQGVESLTDNIPMPTHFDLNDYFAEKGITDDIIGSVKKFKQFRSFSLYLPILFFVFCLVILIKSTNFPKALKIFAFGILVSGISYMLLIIARKPLFLNSLEMNMRADGIGEAQAIIQALEYALVKSLHIPGFFILAGLMILLASILLDLYIPQDSYDEDY